MGGIIDGLRRLGIGASVEFFFLLLDEGALTRPMTFVSAMNAAVRNFLLSAGVFPPTSIGIAPVAPPSSVVLRPGVARFVDGDRIHGLRGLRLLDLMWPRSVAITRPLLVHFFESLLLAFVRDAIFLQYLEEPVDGLWFAALKVLYAQAKA